MISARSAVLIGLALTGAAISPETALAKKTTIEIRSTPAASTVWLYRSTGEPIAKRVSNSTFEITDERDFFMRKVPDKKKPQKVDEVVFWWVAEKEGHDVASGQLRVSRGQKNYLTVQLEPLDTKVVIDVEPRGATLTFDRPIVVRERPAEIQFSLDDGIEVETSSSGPRPRLPYQMRKSAEAPLELVFTKAEAEEASARGLRVTISSDNYIPERRPLDIEVGKTNHFPYRLRELEAVLKVVSSVEGVQIEDISPDSSFGYLGETPFERAFNARDCKRHESFVTEQKVMLQLRASAPGYRDKLLRVEIPWGEEITANVSLRPRSTQITFQTDPAEVHVYLVRSKVEYVFDEVRRVMEEREVEYQKHLGTTPFTYYMDPEDPIEHDDIILFRKTGYGDARARFAAGVGSYHQVLTPLSLMERGGS